MRSIHSGLVVIAIGFLLPGSGVHAQDLSARITRVEQGLLPPLLMKGETPERMSLTERMEEYHAAGVSVAVIDDFEIAWSRAWGVSNAVSKEPLTSESVMQAGSIAKPVAAMLALRLVAAGAFGLDDPANDVLTSLQIGDTKAGGAEPVLVRHLISHSAGLAPGYFPPTERGDAVPSLLDQLKGTRNDESEPMIERIAPPGRQAVYSNPSYGLIQQMLVDVSGEEFDQLAEKKLFGPLSMNRSTFAQTLSPRRFEDAAWGHSWNRESSSLVPLDGKGQVVPGAVGGLWTTPTDLCRFLLGVMNSLRADDGVLPAELADAMITPQVENMGLGVALTGQDDAKRFDQTGGMPGFHAYMIAYPKSGQGAVVMVNGGYRVSRLVHELIQSIAVEYDWRDFNPVRSVIPMDDAAFAPYAGRYKFDYPVEMEMSIASNDGRFYRGRMEMLPVGENVFVLPEAGDEIEFVIDAEGNASSFLYGRPGMGKIRARRLD